MPILLYEGQTGPRVSLQEARRQVHEHERESRAREIAAREKLGVPLEESIVWPSVLGVLEELGVSARAHTHAKVREHAAELLRLTQGAIEPLGAYEADPALDGLSATFVVVSEARRRLLLAEVSASMATLASLSGQNAVRLIEADEASMDAVMAFVAETVESVEGFERLDGGVATPVVIRAKDGKIPSQDLAALRRARVLLPLFVCARAFQELPPGEAVRFGLPRPSTFPATSTAPAAQSNVDEFSVATVVPQVSTLKAHDTRRTGVPGATSSITSTSPICLPSEEQRTDAWALLGSTG